ncbi:MAG: hypothetical protein ACRC1F_02475 [Metamycoplasmataceae bacterium]
MSRSNKYIKVIKSKFNRSNLLVISFLIFLSIAVIVSVILGTERAWFDVISIVSIFYIGIPILILIFTKGGKGFVRKTWDLFKFKEIKNIKRQQFTIEEEKKLRILSAENNIEEHPISKFDMGFISIILIIYGFLLLIITIPSLILF